jgi:hypothetical protein
MSFINDVKPPSCDTWVLVYPDSLELSFTGNTLLSQQEDAIAAGACMPKRASEFFISKFCRKKSADDTGDAVKTFSLPVGTFHGIGFGKVHPFGNPAFRTVGK